MANSTPSISVYLEPNCARDIPSSVINTLVFIYTDLNSLLEECINIAWSTTDESDGGVILDDIELSCDESLYTIVDHYMSVCVDDSLSSKWAEIYDRLPIYTEAMTELCSELLRAVVYLLKPAAPVDGSVPYVTVLNVEDTSNPPTNSVLRYIPHRMRLTLMLENYITEGTIRYGRVQRLKSGGMLL